MKKLLLLCLVLLGGVMQVSADNVNIRIYALHKHYWGDNVYAYAEYWNGSGNTFLAEQKMTWISQGASDSEHMYYVDFTFDKDEYNAAMSNSGVKIKFHNGSGTWTQNYTEIKDFTYNYIFYIDIGGDSKFYQSNGTFTYKFAKYANSALSDAIDLSPSNNVLTTVVDNESSVTEATYVLYPSFATGYASPLKWEFAISPQTTSGNYAVTSFINYSDNLVNQVSTSRGFYVNNVKAKNTFTFDLTNGSFTIRPSFTRTLPAHGYSTFASDYDVAIPEGVTASYATGVENNALVMTDFTNGIPAGTGALLYKAGGNEVTFTPATSTDAVSGNWFVRGNGGTIDQINGDKTNYILTTQTASGTKTVGFYKANATNKNTVANTKAYLSVPTNQIPARGFFTFLEENTTSISSLNKTSDKENVYYNLNGQRVTNPTKGLYIVNGKKVIIK